MTQNKNTPGNQQAGNKPNPQTRDGNRKETDPNNPVANKGTEKSPASNQQRPGPATQQSTSISQQRPNTASNQPKPDKSIQKDGAPVDEADEEIVTDEEVPGKRKSDNPDWSENKPGNPKVK